MRKYPCLIREQKIPGVPDRGVLHPAVLLFIYYRNGKRSLCLMMMNIRVCAKVLMLCGLLCISLTAVAALPVWSGNQKNPVQAQRLSFQCPRAYQGIREDLLPTHWEVFKGRKQLQLKSSQVQGQSMVCAYSGNGRQTVGTIRRLVPVGYKCISDGAGNFRCQKKR